MASLIDTDLMIDPSRANMDAADLTLSTTRRSVNLRMISSSDMQSQMGCARSTR
jgi:hypothetical protein